MLTPRSPHCIYSGKLLLRSPDSPQSHPGRDRLHKGLRKWRAMRAFQSTLSAPKTPTITAKDLKQSGLTDLSVVDFREWINNASAHLQSAGNDTNHRLKGNDTNHKNTTHRSFATITRRQMKAQRLTNQLTATQDLLTQSLEEFANINREAPKQRNPIPTENVYHVQNRKVASVVGSLVWSDDTEINQCPQEQRLQCLRFRHSVVDAQRTPDRNESGYHSH